MTPVSPASVPMPCQCRANGVAWQRRTTSSTKRQPGAGDPITPEWRQAKPRQDVLARTHARCSQSDAAHADRVAGHRERRRGQQPEAGSRVQAPIRRRLACPGRGSPTTQPAGHSRCAPTVPPSVPRACQQRAVTVLAVALAPFTRDTTLPIVRMRRYRNVSETSRRRYPRSSSACTGR